MKPVEMIAALEAAGDYKVLRRLKPRNVFESASKDDQLRIGVLVDLETTGLDVTSDEVIEVGMVKFAYQPDGRVVHVVDTLSLIHISEPTRPY